MGRKQPRVGRGARYHDRWTAIETGAASGAVREAETTASDEPATVRP